MSKELYPGYIVKAKGQKGKVTAVNLHTVVVQLGDHKASFKREDIEVLEAIKDSDVKTYKIDEIQYCKDCGKPKPIEEFPKLKGNKRRTMCKQCFGFRISQGRLANKEPKAKPVTKTVPKIKAVKEVPTVEVKTVKEWVEKNLSKETNKPETELSNLEKMAQEYETKANYYQELATMAKEIVESCRSLDLKLKEREAIHE